MAENPMRAANGPRLSRPDAANGSRLSRRQVLILASAAGAYAALPGAGAAAEPRRQDLFTAGEGGYALYRIPGIVTTARGTLLAYCEARKHAAGDWGHIDCVLRRGEDGGKSWSAPTIFSERIAGVERNPLATAQKLGREGEITANNPVLIAGPGSPAVHALYCLEYNRVFYRRSDDDGQTFGPSTEITAALEPLRKEYDWKVAATGPAHGIRLRTGRLVVPVWLSKGTGGHAHRPSVVTTIVSDDDGSTWKAGDIAVPDGGDVRNPNETVVVELSDGRVLLNSRSESAAHRRLTVVGPDGATGWSKPEFHPELVEPICMASIVRLPAASGSTEPAGLLFANPDNLEPLTAKPGQGRRRKNLTVRLSTDDGKSWPVRRVLEAGVAGYSDLTVSADGTIHCLFERGGLGGDYKTAALTWARFDLPWLRESAR